MDYLKNVVLSLTLAVLLGPAAGQALAEGAFEPNDAPLSATGPLTSGQAFSASLETGADRDFFYFYVTSAPAARVEITVTNLGGGKEPSDIRATVMDASETPISAMSYIRDGELRTATVTLMPQKYLVAVTSNEGYGDAYSVAAGGPAGSLDTHAQIAARCAAATEAVRSTEGRLSRDRERLRRAIGRLRRAHYGTDRELRLARAASRKARQRVAAAEDALARAGSARKPWCFIPE
jgi:hypothetical protein